MDTTLPPAEAPRYDLTVLFDADCSFCQWTVRQLRGMDRGGRLEFVPLGSADLIPGRPELAAVAARYPLRDAIHVVRPGGEVEARGRAMLAILDALPGAGLLRPWTRLPYVDRLADVIYDPIARHRHALGRLVTRSTETACEVSPPASQDGPSAAGR